MLSRDRAERKPNHRSRGVVEGRGKEVSRERGEEEQKKNVYEVYT